MRLKALQDATRSVRVYTRHSADCKYKDDPQWKRCHCRKWLYVYQNGKDESRSAKTRSWAEAEEQARAISDSWDPVKQKLLELDRTSQRRQSEVLTIEAALDRWIANRKIRSSGTASAYRTFVRKFKDWSRENGLMFLSEVTASALDEWRGQWSSDAKRLDDRMGPSTQSEFQVRLKSFFHWAFLKKLILDDPAESLDYIEKDDHETLPLSPEQFAELLSATEHYDAAQRRECDKIGQELRALFLLMRWSGLRIGDAAGLSRSALKGNRLSATMTKVGRLITLIVPDEVIKALNDLPERPGVHPGYFFWSKNCTRQSLSCIWARKINRLNADHLSFRDEHGRPLEFHSHMLRDTFAVRMLLASVPLEDVCKMLGHSSIKVTEKHYAPWIKARQDQLEYKMIAAMQSMGASISL